MCYQCGGFTARQVSEIHLTPPQCATTWPVRGLVKLTRRLKTFYARLTLYWQTENSTAVQGAPQLLSTLFSSESHSFFSLFCLFKTALLVLSQRNFTQHPACTRRSVTPGWPADPIRSESCGFAPLYLLRTESKNNFFSPFCPCFFQPALPQLLPSDWTCSLSLPILSCSAYTRWRSTRRRCFPGTFPSRASISPRIELV